MAYYLDSELSIDIFKRYLYFSLAINYSTIVTGNLFCIKQHWSYDALTVGRNGSPGPQGRQGYTGHTGSTGPRGASGPPGRTGATGMTGWTGIKGIRGISGPQGFRGSALGRLSLLLHPFTWRFIDSSSFSNLFFILLFNIFYAISVVSYFNFFILLFVQILFVCCKLLVT